MSPAAFVAVDELYAGIFEHFADRRNVVGIGVRSPTSNASASPFRLRGAYLTGAFCVTATGAWYLLRTMYHAEAKVTLAKGPGLAAVLVPVQLFFGHLNVGMLVSINPPRWLRSRRAGTTRSRLPRC
jgi:hypothetical protein